ncbi:MAG TPA: S8 family peptidase [Blastocatellia bacterium]|nr:S8 family peptidase [Blastocatellia bacterium]
MKRLALILLIFALLVPLSLGPTAHAQKSDPPRYRPDRILIKLRSGEPVRQTIGDEILALRGTRAETTAVDGIAGPEIVHLNSKISVAAAVARASSDPRVEYAEPDYYVYPTETMPNDPLFNLEWGLKNDGSGFPAGVSGADIGATRAWDLTTGNSEVVVAVSDGGIDLAHPDLSSNIWVNQGEIPGNGMDDDSDGFADDVNGWNFFDDNNAVGPDPAFGSFYGHGTHVAGTIGAIGNNGIGVAGIAWQVKLMSLKLFGVEDGKVVGSTSDAVRSLNFAVMMKNRGVNIRVFNASWAGDDESQSLQDAITMAGNNGIVFVCAAGNSAQDMDNPNLALWPASWNNIGSLISVAALDRTDNLASYSNYGRTTISIAAPGSAIYSTFPNADYRSMSGTSMATPHVSGIAALVAAYDPGLSAAAIKQRIVSNADPVTALASKVSSAGRANAYNALTNTHPAGAGPVITRVDAPSKKLLVIDGSRFVQGAMVVEVNGVPIPVAVNYDSGFVAPDGTFNRMNLKTGKPLMKQMLPAEVQVSITVFNQVTGQRSAPFSFTRIPPM